MIKANEYFEGNVKSLALENSEGRATVGVISQGEYEFGTATIEIMHVISGELNALLPGEQFWKNFKKGEFFKIEKGVKFKVQVKEPVAYLCFYI
jgi:uncharacterized protein YaiE (UPF0345 family)